MDLLNDVKIVFKDNGVGMFLCKALIKLQGGKLMVESSEDKYRRRIFRHLFVI